MKCKIVNSDLGYSPTQLMTEYHHVELKDHNASEKTKQEFEELKTKYPEVLSFNNEDIGHTQFVSMDMIQVIVQQYVKNCIPFPSNITVGFNKK